MATKTVLCNIDFTKNQIQNALLHPLAVAPTTPSQSQVYYNSGSNKLFVSDGTSWFDISGQINAITTSTTPALSINVTDPANPILEIANVDGVNSGLMTSADFTKLGASTSANTAGTIVSRDVNGDISVGAVTATKVTGLVTPVGATDATSKAYVDNLVSSGMKIKGSIDASTNPNYPAGVIGDAYYISVAGLIGGVSGTVVAVGDLIIVVTDNAGGDQVAVGASWIILETNAQQATELLAGFAEVATSAEVTTGTDDLRIVTPLKLAQALASLGTGNVGSFTQAVGNGVNTQFTVTHSLNSAIAVVSVIDSVSNAEVEVCVTVSDANNVVIDFNVAPTTNQYTVNIHA